MENQVPKPVSGHPVYPFETAQPLAPQGKIDELAFRAWRQAGIHPAYACSDEGR